MIIWLTGPPGSGKTTLGRALCAQAGRAVLLDGDDLRNWLTPDCDFSDAGRWRHAMRTWNVASRISQTGALVVVALVAHPPRPVDRLVALTGSARRPLWPGTSWSPPTGADLYLDTSYLTVARCVEMIHDCLAVHRALATVPPGP